MNDPILNKSADKASEPSTIILGAGITGLAAGYISGLPVYEAKEIAGGICTSYYMKKGSKERLYEAPADGEAYHFEIGGGHWVFGGDPSIVRFMDKVAPFKRYARRASIYLPDQKVFAPYPIQNNLFALPKALAQKAAKEMTTEKKSSKGKPIKTMSDWLEMSFGPTLGKLFFAPFHKLYTAGLYTKIAPQDSYKSPVSEQEVLNGLSGKAKGMGYNTTFIYPEKGLDFLAGNLEKHADVRYGKRVTKIDVKKKTVAFADGSVIPYNEIISTLPLNLMEKITGIKGEGKAHPSPGVLVINIGALKGPKCPNDHWIYIPKSKAGFHRVGFYNAVDPMFLPKSNRAQEDRASIYVEKAYPEGKRPTAAQMEKDCRDIIKELTSWGWIGEVEAYDPTWIEVAYTWAWPNSKWRETALKALEKHGIYQIGRYGRWVFQGIADSIKDGLMVGGAFADKNKATKDVRNNDTKK